jgi:hypothetical protein
LAIRISRWRRIDGVEVGVQDVVAVADVVADQEGGGLPAGRFAAGRWRAGEAEAALEIDPGRRFPTCAARRGEPAQGRAFDAHGVVVARAQVGRRVVVADDVDAADEGDAPVDDDQLAVQAAQAVARRWKRPISGR